MAHASCRRRHVAVSLASFPAKATEAGWALLRDGEHVVLLRHAMAPGAADPADFDIEKCSTQRNLSERGKQQARKIGALFAARAASTERVLTSRYCRTRETARLAFGDAEDFAPLDPPAADEAARKAQLDAIVKDSPRLFRLRQPRPRHASGDDPGADRPARTRGRGRHRRPWKSDRPARARPHHLQLSHVRPAALFTAGKTD